MASVFSAAMPLWATLLAIIVDALVFIGIPLSLFLFARRFLRAYERRVDAANEIAELKERILRLEERISELADENARLADGNRFVTSLLAERRPPAS